MFHMNSPEIEKAVEVFEDEMPGFEQGFKNGQKHRNCKAFQEILAEFDRLGRLMDEHVKSCKVGE